MKKRAPKEISKYLFWAVIALLVILSFFIIKPFIIPLISAFILAYLTKPLYNKLKLKLPNSLSAILCVLLALIIFVLPLGAILTGITTQASSSLNKQSIKDALNSLSSLPLISSLNINLEALTQNVINLIISLLSSALSHLPSIILSVLIIFFGMYYILLSWDPLSKKLKDYLPFTDKEKVARDIAQTTNSLIYGTILIAAIQFALAIAGFYLSGVSAFLLLPALIFFLAFIPGLGPAVVWVPMAIFYFFTKDYPTLIGVLLTGLILSIYIDTILRAKLLSKKSKLNPLLMLIGILGGISIFGIFGFIIGPLILNYTIKLLEEAVKER